MKRVLFSAIYLLFLVLSACGEGDDYRDPYVGNYVGSGYSGTVTVEGIGVSEEIESVSNVISVSKDKSDINMLIIKIDDQSFPAHLENGGLDFDPVEVDVTGSTPGYTYQVYQSGAGTITATTINLQLQYSGTATYNPDPNDPSKIRTYNVGGSGMGYGTK